MVHVKRGDYAHWAVRIDRAARRVTHLSAGPVVKARDYRNEVGELPAKNVGFQCELIATPNVLKGCWAFNVPKSQQAEVQSDHS